MRIINQSNHCQLIAYYESEYDRLMHIGQYYCDDKEELKDIIHQLFLHFGEKEIDLNLIDNPRSYIITSFKRRLIDYLRTTAKREINSTFIYRDIAELSIDKIIEENESTIEMVIRLRNTYEKLPDRCKKVIYLKFYKGLNNNEIISQTGLSIRSVYNNLSEGIKIMRKEMVNQQIPLKRTAFLNLLPLLFYFS